MNPKINPTFPGHLDANGVLQNPAFAVTVIAILVSRLGGEITIPQSDFDAIAGSRLHEGDTSSGDFAIKLEPRPNLNG